MKSSLLCLAALLVTMASAADAATIDWWQFWTDPSVKPTIDSIVSEFETANPGTEVEVTDLTWANGHEKIVIALSSGTGPDILELGSDWIAQFAAEGHLADLSSWVSADSGEFDGWSLTTYGDKVYGHPWILGTRVLFCNGDLLDRAGYENGFVPINLTQFKEAVYKVDSLSSDVSGWGSNTHEKHRLYKKFLPFFWTYGARLFSPDGHYCLLSSLESIEALRVYKDLHDSCGWVDSQRGIEDAFLDGKIGFILSGDWLLKRIEVENRQFSLRSTLFPGQNFPGRSFMGGEFLAINSASEQVEAAQRFIKFLTTPENQVRFCRANRSANPSSAVAQADQYFETNPHLQTFIKQLTMSKHPPVDPDWVNIESILEDAVADALFGSQLVAEPLLEARRAIEKLKGR